MKSYTILCAAGGKPMMAGRPVTNRIEEIAQWRVDERRRQDDLLSKLWDAENAAAVEMDLSGGDPPLAARYHEARREREAHSPD